MEHFFDNAASRRMDAYIRGIGSLLANKRQRASFAAYARGLFGPGERKSIEPIAARTCGDPDVCSAWEQRIGHFLTNAKWSDERVRAYAAEYAIGAMTRHGPVISWIVDDTGFVKQGKHSVGVQRQYSGTLGKTGNCQVATSLTIATRYAHSPIDFELYLPECWLDDPKRRREARIPDDVQFQTKLQLATKMIHRAFHNGVPRGRVLVDTAYGNSNDFRMELRQLGLEYGVAIQGPTKVWRLDRLERIRGEAVSVRDLAVKLVDARKFRRSTWREGTSARLTARFAAVRVACAYDNPTIEPRHREALWLFIEWPDNEAEPTKFYFCTGNTRLSRRQLVRAIKERYRTERTYEDMKGEIGLDHYEGRRWPGWNHHVTVAISCFAFAVAEQARLFPPKARRTQDPNALALAA